MAEAKRDQNFVPTLIAASSVDGTTPVVVYADPTTHRLYVDSGGGSSGLTVGSSSITGGTTTRVLYDNAGVLGEYSISGSGSVAMTTSPVFVTPTLGAASATTINLASISYNVTNASLSVGTGYNPANGQFNSALGNNALVNANSSATANMAFGLGALVSNTSGSYNVGIGVNAVSNNVTGSYNVGIGNQAIQGTASNSFSNNVGIGAFAGNTLTTGSSNVFIGYYAGYNTTTDSNSFFLGNIQQASLANDKAFSLLYGTFAGSAGTLSGNTLKVNGTLTVNSPSATALAVGPNGTTNPVLTVDASTASQADGISIKGGAAGGGTTITATSSGSNSGITIAPIGTGNFYVNMPGTGAQIKLGMQGTDRINITSSAITFLDSQHIFNSAASGTAANTKFTYVGAADTNITASTDALSVYFNMGQTRQHATGDYTTQRDFRITPSTHSAVGTSTITNAATLYIDSAPAAGTNVTITNPYALWIAAGTARFDGNVQTSQINTPASTALKVNAGSYQPYQSDTDGATVTFDLSVSNVHTVTLGGNRTLALSNVQPGQCFIINLVQDGTGSRTVTWFSTIKWPGGTAPTLTTTINKTDTLGFICTSAGNYLGYIVAQNL